MRRYLDPKSDIVFKKIFGEHPNLLKSFLNALLPLTEEQLITELAYLPTEQIPSIPVLKRTIVDVKCKDKSGRVFIVEMQMEGSHFFMQRLLFGTAQAYVKQIGPGERYDLLLPVYGLGLVNSVFDRNTPRWYHHYGVVKIDNPQEEIVNGLTLIFVELPKFKVNTREDKQLKILWLRFLRELGEQTKDIPPEWLAVPEIQEAVRLTEESAYTLAELEYYESYWKQVSSEKTMMFAAKKEGREEGIKEGIEKGIEKGELRGEKKAVKILMETKFGPIPEALLTKLEKANTVRLENIIRELATATRPEDLSL